MALTHVTHDVTMHLSGFWPYKDITSCNRNHIKRGYYKYHLMSSYKNNISYDFKLHHIHVHIILYVKVSNC